MKPDCDECNGHTATRSIVITQATAARNCLKWTITSRDVSQLLGERNIRRVLDIELQHR